MKWTTEVVVILGNFVKFKCLQPREGPAWNMVSLEGAVQPDGSPVEGPAWSTRATTHT